MSMSSPIKLSESEFIDLATHDSGGITALDVKLAHSMEELAARHFGK